MTNGAGMGESDSGDGIWTDLATIGRKNDQSKLRYDLLPPRTLEDVVKVLTFGANKYEDNNWKKVDSSFDRYYAAAMRHLQAFRQGEKIDNESEASHLAHAICCLVFLNELHGDRSNES